MIRKLSQLLLIVTMLSLVTGCWNRRELNTLGIAVGFGIDKAGDQYQVSVQVVDPGETASRKGTTGRSPVILYRATGVSVFEALRKITRESPRKIYLSHIRILVIGEAMAREGIADVLDFLSRDHELRTDFYIVVAKHTKADQILKVLTSLEKIPSMNLFNALQTSEKSWAPTVNINLSDLILDLTSEGKQAVLTGIAIKGTTEIGETDQNIEMIDPSTRLQYSGIAVFNGDKLIGWLNENDSRSYNYIVNHVNSTVRNVTCKDGGQLSLEVIRSKTKVKGNIENGKPAINVNIRLEANVGDVACHVDLTKRTTVAEIEQTASQKVRDNLDEAIHNMQKQFKVDIYGFGEVIHRTEPKLWKQISKEWESYFVNLPVHVNVVTKIRRLGTVNNSFIEEMKK